MILYKAKRKFNNNPRFVVTVAVPDKTKFECASLEEFLLTKIKTTDNTLGSNRLE